MERKRPTAQDWDVVHMYKTGQFYTAYDWSAWIISVISYTDAVRMQTKDRHPLAVTRIKIATSEQTFCKVGFPFKSIEKFCPNRQGFDGIENDHITFRIPLPQPQDGSEVTYDRLSEAVAKWKEAQPLKQPKDKKDSDPQEDTDRQPKQGKTKRTLMSLIQETQQQQSPSQGGLIMQIMSYQLSEHTPAENYEFIQRLQQQIASIL